MRDQTFTSKAFLDLRWKWYEKLKKDGKFVDIEYFCRDTGESLPTLDGMSPMDVKKSHGRWGDSKVEYYRLSEQHKRQVQRRFSKASWQYAAWTKHSDGVGTKAIAAKLGRSASEVVRFVKAEAARMRATAASDNT